MKFSVEPQDKEFFQASGLPQPLVPTKGTSSSGENRALAAALLANAARTNPDDFSALEGFLTAYPQSRWRLSLLSNLGTAYFKTGYFSRALTVWEQAWALGKSETDPTLQVITDKVAAELAKMNARIGRADRLETLFSELKGREIHGSASELLAGAKEGLWLMRNKPADAFRCGPLALDKVRAVNDPKLAFDPKIDALRSEPKGVSLTQLQAFASGTLGMDCQTAKRTPGAGIITPAVVHWKVGHYAAIIRAVNGRYLIQDPTFGEDLWVTPAALDAEASGYFLVRGGALPAGWQPATMEEASAIWGKGNTGSKDPDRTDPCDKKSASQCPSCSGMAQYAVHSMLVSLNLVDTPLLYTPPLGPSVSFTVTYNQRDANQTLPFTYTNLGPQWTFNFVSFLIDDSTNAYADVKLYERGGGARTYTGYNATTKSYQPQLFDQSVLVRTSPTAYELQYSDGSKQIFDVPDLTTGAGRKVFLRQTVDAQGNALSYTYDNGLRLTAITDAVGQITHLEYDQNNTGLKIVKITDPFLRTALFDYNAAGQLAKITDAVGMTSEFGYGSGDFINMLITPYGTTTFAYGDATTDASLGYGRWLEVTDPYGAKERVEFRHNAPGIADSEPSNKVPTNVSSMQNSYLSYRNTFFWSKKAMMEGAGDYTKAQLTHWLHHGDPNIASGIVESEKQPLENRVWYTYEGQPYPIWEGIRSEPSQTSRVLDDGTTQLTSFAYNALGNLIQRTDPAGRVTYYDYDTNGIDLLTTRQATGSSTSDILEQRIYDPTFPPHLPKQVIDAAGQATSYEYTTAGKVQKITNAKGEQTTFSFTRPDAEAGPSDGYLYSITRPAPNQGASSTTTYRYDSLGRLKSTTDPEQYTVSFNYDALNRLLTAAYPDGTGTQRVYDRLDVEWSQDRLGRWTHNFYDALRHLVAVEDSSGRTTNYGYCLCGALTSMTDPAGNVTQWAQDIQGRQISKTYADGTIWTTTYENTTSRVMYTTDAKQQRKHYDYNVDDTLAKVRYTDTSDNDLVPATSTVAYTYDPVYQRLTQIDDGIGRTKYAYNPAQSAPPNNGGQLSSVDGPFDNDTITYGYDELGRATTQAINGGTNTSTFGYDSIGRLHTGANPLGVFTYTYVNNTGRLENLAYPNGQITRYSYFDGTNDPRLRSIVNATNGNSVISQFDYTYNAVGDILTWMQNNSGLAHSQQYAFGYDNIDELTSATLQDTVTGSISRSQAYRYDAAMNRTLVQDGGNISTETPNNLNQLTGTSGGGMMRFAGTVNKPATVTVGGNVATVHADGSYEGWAQVNGTGATRVHIVATDASGNVTDRYTDVTPSSVATQSFGYDPNGNQTAAGPSGSQTTYGWDAANRLVSITQGGHTTRFDYDGQGRRVRESLDGAEITRWVWIGTHLAEERDSGNNVTKRFFEQGEQLSGQPYYYTRDHQGSICELLDNAGIVVARYNYNMYGLRSANQISNGAVEADFGFTGHYLHQREGMYLALYREYNSAIGRWLSRDPMEEKGGINLYDYGDNDPVNKMDLLGLNTSGKGTPSTPFAPPWEHHDNILTFKVTCPKNSKVANATVDYGKTADDLSAVSLPVPSLGNSTPASISGVNCCGNPVTITAWMRTRLTGTWAPGQPMNTDAYVNNTTINFDCVACPCSSN